jgi:hypothetical protein
VSPALDVVSEAADPSIQASHEPPWRYVPVSSPRSGAPSWKPQPSVVSVARA